MPKFPKTKKSIIQFIISILISAIFLYLTISKIDFKQSIESLKTMNYLWIIPAVFFHMIVFGVRAIKWKILLNNIKNIKFFNIYKITTIGFMMNNVLPFRLGEIARSHLMGKEAEISRSGVLGTIFIEKISDAISLLIIIFTLGIFVNSTKFTNNILAVLIFIALIAFVILSIVFEKQILILLEKFSPKIQKLKLLQNFLTSFITGLKTIKDPKSFFIVGFTSLLVWVMESVPYYFIAQGFGFDLSFLQILLLCSVVNIGLLIPSSPGYIGTFHFFCVLVLTSFGIHENISLSYAVITHLVLWIPITIVGLIFFTIRKKL